MKCVFRKDSLIFMPTPSKSYAIPVRYFSLTLRGQNCQTPTLGQLFDFKAYIITCNWLHDIALQFN